MGEAHEYWEQAIMRTLRYFAIFDMPLTATQLWRCLLLDPHESTLRWGGHAVPTLAEIQVLLATSSYVQARVEQCWGYFFLKDSEGIVQRWLKRHRQAQAKWKIARKVARVMSVVPFVRMLAGSGSLALFNTSPSSDLDVLVVAHRRRIWTARLLLLGVTQLMGRRRTHWERQAPDKVCLNHYLSDDSLTIAPAIHNEYTAMQYTHLVPLYGLPVFRDFQMANRTWLTRFAMMPELPANETNLLIHLPGVVEWLKRQVESVLLEPIGGVVERWAETWQRQSIARHAVPGQSGRIHISNQELAFHPHSQADHVVFLLHQEEGQRQLM